MNARELIEVLDPTGGLMSTVRTQFGYTRREQDTCERLIVRYRLPGGGWQADRVLPAVWDQSELKAQRRLRELRAEGKVAEIIRRTPIM